MAEFVTTAEINARLEKIIKDANDRLILISPFIRVNRRVRELVQEQDRQKIDVRFVYGKREADPSEKNWLESMSSVRTSFYAHLHAKCYLNENAALLTSMNLYESSQVKNYEMGIYISRVEDPELYESILNEAKYLLTNSDPPLKDTSTKSGTSNSTRQNTRLGHCIRCKTNIAFNPQEDETYCSECRTDWEKNDRRDYQHPEKYCHSCGKEHEGISFSRPMCGTCYAENPMPPGLLKTSTPP